MTEDDEKAIGYVLRYGGMCRDCADTAVRGICDHSGMPCNTDIRAKMIAHALNAWRYGIKHGFIHNPLQTAGIDPVLEEQHVQLAAARAQITRLQGDLEQAQEAARVERVRAEAAEARIAKLEADNGRLKREHETADAALSLTGLGINMQQVYINTAKDMGKKAHDFRIRAEAAEAERDRLRGEIQAIMDSVEKSQWHLIGAEKMKRVLVAKSAILRLEQLLGTHAAVTAEEDE